MTSRLARLIVRRRVPIIGLWVLFGALALPRAMRVHEALRVEGQTLTPSESKAGRALIQEAFALPVTHFFVVTMHGPVPIDSLPYQAVLDSLVRSAAREP